MNYISVFDILKIGVGPSSSHTLGPWRAARFFVTHLKEAHSLSHVNRIIVKLYGSLALTGKGHGTDIAIILGLSDADPVTVPMDIVNDYPNQVTRTGALTLPNKQTIPFVTNEHIEFHGEKQLDYHPNGLEFFAYQDDHLLFTETYYSVGGGFVLEHHEINKVKDLGTDAQVPYNITNAKQIKLFCKQYQKAIHELAWKNERAIKNKDDVKAQLDAIWREMLQCIYRGCHTEGQLPGGLHVRRRAHDLYYKLAGQFEIRADSKEWLNDLAQKPQPDFQTMVKWISCFAMAVNEENANFGRVVTAPTNGAAGVIPAVLAYLIAFTDKEVNQIDIENFLLTAGVIGGLYKNGATISAAMGGCQAEIGVSSSMAAVALTESLGGTIDQALMAGEIAMEHHLGLTCDPVNGLVQIPCIERNTMGAIKAITAANLALSSDPSHAKVSLDSVIKTMWETAQDMNHKYKETSLGGLATNISVIVPEC